MWSVKHFSEFFLEGLHAKRAPPSLSFFNEPLLFLRQFAVAEKDIFFWIKRVALDIETKVSATKCNKPTRSRKSPLTILFVVPLQNGTPTNDIERTVYGYFLEKEKEVLGGPDALEKCGPELICRFGREKVTPTRKKIATSLWYRNRIWENVEKSIWSCSGRATNLPGFWQTSFLA